MGERARGFAIAVLITTLDVVVVSCYGPAIWQAWGATPWLRVVLLLLAGTGAFTLADIWACTVRYFTKRQPLMEIDDGKTANSFQSNALEDADV